MALQETEEDRDLESAREAQPADFHRDLSYNPLDAVGWHGNLHPVRINVKDLRPLMSHRFHVPPSAHTTFVANRFVVCTFAPRPFESDPGAIKVPFFHNNDDYDEVLF